MKRRFIPVISITVALLLIGGLAYALEKKKQAQPVDRLSDTTREEEALQAELLAATGDRQVKLPEKETATPGKNEPAGSGDKKEQSKTDK